MRKRLVILATLVCLTFTGCAMSDVSDQITKEVNGSVGFGDISSSSTASSSDEYVVDDSNYASSPSFGGQEEADYAENVESSNNDVASDGNTSNDSGVKLTQEKIVYHGDVEIATSEFDKAKAALDKLVEKYGAILESDNYRIYDNVKHESICLRIPAENFNAFMDSTGDIGKVTNKSTSSKNISKEYVDVQARISAYETKVERLNNLLESASTVEEITNLYDQLSDAEYELESAKSQLLNMDTDVAYSYLDIDITDTHRYTDTGDLQGDGSYWSDVVYSFWDSISGFVRALGNILIVLIYLLPYIIVIGIVALIVKAINKKRGKKSFKERRAEKKALQNAAGAAAIAKQIYNPYMNQNPTNVEDSSAGSDSNS